MAEKIGKYQLLERIGRGGMGTIFKAHDPILDRAVALKVISTEVEVTDELRARFFREAQACARLSHPNIVTIYDIGEHDGRLFIVMELLEGDEVRQLIAQRTALALEDKLAIMGQVCKGLHYAHQRGIVHRDIKPGNILVQRNGQVKILDFGIAQIATTGGGLTRTGLIMGTLRYISPEQVRGRADARSDMFSAGAVLYELLSLQPPFSGENPLHLLEQLRTEEPPRLSEVDRTIPVEVAAIVERAMRKEPAERFADLEEMRAQIEHVQRGLAEQAQRVRAQVRGQRDQLLQLQAALAERVGPPRDKQEVAAIDERGRLATARALARDFADRIEMLQGQLARADRLAGAVRRGIELLDGGQLADAVMELEAVVAEMPEHGRAVEALGRARAGAAEERYQQLAAKLVQEAQAALDEGGYALGLELLRQAAEIHPSAEAALEIARLREGAEATQAREAARRARQQAEGVREQMGQARRAAQAKGASQYAAALWAEAEGKAGEGQAALAREAYAEAGEAFGAAAGAHRRGAAAARAEQARQRAAAERAREQGAQAQQSAEAAGALLYARELWEAAEQKFAQGQAAVAKKVLGDAASSFDAAAVLYRQAAEAAGGARQRERRHAEEARDRAAQGQRSAAETDADQHAATLWGEALAKSGEGRAALDREQYGKAAEAFSAAAGAYQEAENQARVAREAVRALELARADAEKGLRREAEQQRRQAEAAPGGTGAAVQDATVHGGPMASDAEETIVLQKTPPNIPTGESAGSWRRANDVSGGNTGWPAVRWARGIVIALGGLVTIVAGIYWLPLLARPGVRPPSQITQAPIARSVEPPARPEAAEELRKRVETARKNEEAARVDAERLPRAEANPPVLPPRKVFDAQTGQSGAVEARRPTPDSTAAPAGERERIALRKRALDEAAGSRVAAARTRQDAEQARARMASARRAAEQAAAGFHAPRLFASAQAKERDGIATLGQSDYSSALRLFGEAQSDYQAAAQEARQEADAERQLAPLKASVEQSRARAAAGRGQALSADAERLAKELFDAAQAKHVEADSLVTQQNLAAAARAYQDAADRYAAAAQRAQTARGAR